VSLRRIVRDATGINLYECRLCADCDLANIPRDAQDVSLSALVQMVTMDDEEVLSTRTLWSDVVLEAATSACKRGLDLHAALLALRAESMRREQNDQENKNSSP
jgi:hypothetical protein